METEDMALDKRAAEELHSRLQKLPQNQWPNIISKLPHKKRATLVNYLNTMLKKEQVKDGDFPLAANESLRNETHEQPIPATPFIPSTTSPVYSFKSEQDEEKTPLSTTTRKTIDTLVDTHMINVLEEKPMMEAISQLLFVAGDSPSPSRESIEAVHSYLNMWIAAIWCAFLKYAAPFKSEKIVSILKRFIKLRFPVENSKYLQTESIFKSARRIASSLTASKSLAQDVVEKDMKDWKLGHASDRERGHGCESNASMAAFEDILCAKRFEYRLQYRDIRTSLMTHEEYEGFVNARSKSFNSNRSAFYDWLNSAASLNATFIENTGSTNSNTKAFPQSTVGFWMFLVTDRLNLIVETAKRIEFIGDCFITPAMFNPKVSLPSFQVIVNSLQSVSPTSSSTSTDRKQASSLIDPIAYKCAIELLLKLVDVPLLQLTGSFSLNSLNEGCTGPRLVSKNAFDIGGMQIAPKLSSDRMEGSRSIPETLPDLGDVYSVLGLSITSQAIESIGLDDLWSEIVKQSSGFKSNSLGADSFHITEFMLFISIRLKHILWKHRGSAEASKVFGSLLSEWQSLQLKGQNASSIMDSDGSSDALLTVAELHRLTEQLNQYLQIAQKVTNVFAMLLTKFPQYFNNLVDTVAVTAPQVSFRNMNLSIGNKRRYQQFHWKKENSKKRREAIKR